LRGAGGALLALPLLPSLRAHGAAETFPKRLVTMYTPNGFMHDAWWPSSGGETDFVLNKIHEPLASYRDRLTILKNLDLKVAGGGPGGPHQRGIGCLFTGQQLLEGDFVDGCGSHAGWANGISVDQEVANHIGVDSMFKSLELGVRATENDVQGRISYAGPGQPLPPMVQPLDVYNRLFKDLVVAPSDGSVDPLKLQRKSVLDAVGDQFAHLNSRVSVEDRIRLESHAELVRDLERRIASVPVTCDKPEAPAVFDPASEVDMPTIAELEIDLLALAFACDLTRVASFEISTGLNRIRYPWVDSLGEGHPLSHMPPTNADSHDQLVRRMAWHAGLIARLADRLSQVTEGEGTALDNLLLVWSSEVSEGNTHSHVNTPFLLLGGGWHFPTGRYLDCGSASHSDLLVSVLNTMGVETNTFGLPGPEAAPYVTGPLAVL
jgi:hypothetical protein